MLISSNLSRPLSTASPLCQSGTSPSAVAESRRCARPRRSRDALEQTSHYLLEHLGAAPVPVIVPWYVILHRNL
jgi:hypothetical protein